MFSNIYSLGTELNNFTGYTLGNMLFVLVIVYVHMKKLRILVNIKCFAWNTHTIGTEFSGIKERKYWRQYNKIKTMADSEY